MSRGTTSPRIPFLAVAVLIAVGAAATAAHQVSAQSLLVLSKRDHTLAAVDPVSLKVVARAPVGPDPHEVIASSDGAMAYVSIYGGGAFHELSVIDLKAKKALPSIDLGALDGPHGLTFVGGKLWFTAEGAKAIGRFDPATQKVDWIMGSGQDRTHMIWVSPDQKLIYTSNVSSATVSVFEMTMRSMMPPPPPGENGPGGPPNGGPPPGGFPGGGAPRPNWEQTVIPVGKGSEGFDVSPDGHELWVANAQDGTVSVIDTAAKTVSATLPANVPGANRLKFTLDGKLVFISGARGGDLVVMDASTRAIVKRIPIGRGSAGILMQPDGARAYIACGPDNSVAVLDLKTMSVVGHIDAGGEPDGMAWAVAAH